MTCGRTSASFKNIDDDDEQPPLSSSPPVERSKKCSRSSSNKNPYSARGLDKFSTVLGELKARRNRIIEQAGAGSVSLVKFAYSNSSSDWIPLVVRQRPDRKECGRAPSSPPPTTKTTPSPPRPKRGLEEAPVASQLLPGPAAVKGIKVSTEKRNGGGLRDLGVEEVKEWMKRKWRDDHRMCYWGLVMVLVLLCLVTFGRVFAICCMLVWWYLVPVVHGDGEGRDHAKRNRRRATAHSSSLCKKN